jgi:NAD(P)H-dependent flavin oxidoreductase YrpB (nitropropane dioxygenase family)
MPSGQVAGLIEDLPSCAELIGRIMTEAEQRLASLGRLTGPAPPGAPNEAVRRAR